jgi:hypothetical protein
MTHLQGKAVLLGHTVSQKLKEIAKKIQSNKLLHFLARVNVKEILMHK